MSPAPASDPTAPVASPLPYPDQSLAQTPIEVPCDDLLPAWSALLRPYYGDAAVLRVTHIATGGSDRSFYRVEPLDGRESTIMCVTQSRSEYADYLSIGRFLAARGLPVPAFRATSDATGLALLEDAGRQALQHVVLAHGVRAAQTMDAYRAVLRTLGQLQAIPAAACCPEMTRRPFSESDLRWETEYFRENFLGRHLGWDLSADATLTAELAALAARVLQEPLVPMHRDFQSQNVLIEDDQVRIIDFQGARLGPAPYDVASLLRDPYVSLPADVEDTLLAYYHAHVGPASGHTRYETFRAAYTAASLQRMMQALGAYAFLSMVKAKPWFRGWMSPALDMLTRAVGEVDDMPRLREVVAEARARQSHLEG